MIKDSYEDLFHLIGKDKLFEFGRNNIITIPKDKAYAQWDDLKKRIKNKTDDIYIRGYGRNGQKNHVYEDLYKEIFNINVCIDATNNNKPTKLIEEGTGHRKNKTIRNYQVSHVFGRTKNIYSFTAPWNITFIPKVMDPFTGHEAKGDYVAEFTKMFTDYVYNEFHEMIDEYNGIMKKKSKDVSQWLDGYIFEGFNDKAIALIKSDVQGEFGLIKELRSN